MIVADIHEPDELKKIADKVEDLGFDYLVVGSERTYVIERKTVDDLVSSIRYGRAKVKNRLFEQLVRIVDVCKEQRSMGKNSYPLLIVEGNIFSKYRAKVGKITPQQWFGIQAMVCELGVGILRTASINETIVALEVLRARSGKSVRVVSDLAIDKSLRDIKTEMMHVLMAISGVGEKKATALLRRFNTIRNVANASKGDLAIVVGDKLGEHIFDVFNTKFNGGGGLSER